MITVDQIKLGAVFSRGNQILCLLQCGWNPSGEETLWQLGGLDGNPIKLYSSGGISDQDKYLMNEGSTSEEIARLLNNRNYQVLGTLEIKVLKEI